PFVQDATAEKPANTGTEKRGAVLRPALVWVGRELVHGRTPEPIGCVSWYLYPGQVCANASLAIQPQRLHIIGSVQRHQGDSGPRWTIHRVAMRLWSDVILLLRDSDRGCPLV